MTVPISIVITTYNRERFLSAAIETVLAQTKQDFELLIWDDGSTDRSVEIAQHYAQQDRRVRVVVAQHLGRGRALKLAIAQTCGTYVGLVDSDDLLAPTALEETAQVLEREPNVGMVYTSYLDIDEQNAIVSYGYRCLVPYSKERLLHQFMTFHFRLIRRSVYEQVGGFNELFNCAQDYDLCLRLSEITEIRHVNQPLYYYRTHPQSISHQQQTQQARDAQLAIAQAYQRRRNSKASKRTEGVISFGAWYKKRVSSPGWKVGATVSSLASSLLPFTLCFLPSVVTAQPIVSDGTTNTLVTPDGNFYNISGGELSGNGENLFHSFSQFGLNPEQTANFLSNPSILNILGRVTGGNASLINGLIQVSGGNSNLFLMNPAGIVFGSNAQLNVPASFTATTATGIGLDGGWFKALGTNNYSSLVGTPNAFRFATSQVGVIVNSGNLAVPVGENSTLIGGTVVSSGSLQAPAGNITVTSVPGSSWLRLSQSGQILNLEVKLPTNGEGNLLSITPLMLPQLLTGEAANLAMGVSVNNLGQAQLTDSGVGIEVGDVVTSQLNSGTATLSAQNNLSLIESNLVTSGDMNLLAQNTVFVRDSIANPFLAQAGGNLYIQGNQGINILALNHLTQKAFLSGGDLSLVSNGIISGDAHYASGGRFSVLNLSGGGGDFVSYFDPIISSTEDVVFGNYTGVSLKVETLGSITVTGDIVITGVDDNLNRFCNPQTNCSDDAIALGTQPTLILRAGLDVLEETNFNYPGTVFAEVPPDSPGFGFPPTVFSATGETSTPGNVTVDGDINVGLTNQYGTPIRTGGPVTISSITGDIQTGDINTFSNSFSVFNATGGDVSLQAGGNISTGVINTSGSSFSQPAQGGEVTLLAGGNILFESINAQGINTFTGGGVARGGDVILTSNGVIQGTGDIAGNTINTQGRTQGGSVTIQHDGGIDNVPFTIGDATNNGTAGAITTGTVTVAVGEEFPTPGLVTRGTTPGVDGVQVTFVNSKPTLTANQQLPGVQQNQPLSFTFADLGALVDDTNGDNTSIILEAIATGTLTRNGVPLALGDTILPGDTLVYTPPADTTGQLSAFSIAASDRVSFSEPQQVSINVTALPPNIPPDIPPDVPPDIPPDVPPDLPVDNPLPEETPLQKLPLISDLPPLEIDSVVAQLEESLTRQFEQYFGQPSQTPITSLDEAREILNEIEKATGIKPAILYVTFVPQTTASLSQQSTQSPENLLPQDNDQLELVMITAKGTPVRKQIAGATRTQVLKVAQDFRSQVTNFRRPTGYLASAQQLYQWLVAPLESDLQERDIQNLVFLMDTGLRSLPVAALHDEKGFLIERYSVALMPSLSLSDTRYKDIKESQVLAMGAEKFTDQPPLPAVPIEVSTIADQLWQGKSFLNDAFTLENLTRSRQQQPFGIIHLATHGDFQPGAPSNSYIQLWDTKLRLNQLRQLGWNNPAVELLVLSACRTALGNEEAELGFAGLSVLAGVKSSLASLWYVSDEATLGLMTGFYEQLKSAPIKAEALRRAQLAMLKGEVRLEGGKLRTLGADVPLPPELAALGDQTLEHPYYWSAFTMIGNPW
ncbi:CHAT domain-containing protein [Microcoleus sp. FACHB-SPT15]|nr:CHAT domain-containing protein [Microcoleus sp. FACHB-SPT15]